MNYESTYKVLSDFIKNNSDWKEKLKPYMKSFNKVDFNENWLVLMYSLFDIPKDPELFQVIKRCRGSIVDVETGEVICAPFIKFWNYGEGPADKIDWNTVKITHKRDGWIFKAFKYKGQVYFASNGRTLSKNESGSLVDYIPGLPRLNTMSEVLARAWKLGCGEDLTFAEDGHLTVKNSWLDKFEDNCTFCFELESPWNKVHTDLVKDAKLWLIMYRGSDGNEVDVWTGVKDCSFERPAVYKWKTVEEMLESLKLWTAKDNGEGVVAMDSMFHRVKVKTEDYRRIKFETNFDELGDNRLFKYYCMNEVDDLCAVNDNVKARVAEITKNVQLYKKWLKDKIEDVNKISLKYADKKDFYKNIDKDFPKEATLYKKLYGRDAEKLYEDFLEKGKSSKTLYHDTLLIMGLVK